MKERQLDDKQMLMVNFGFNVLVLLAVINIAEKMRGKLNIKKELQELKMIFD